MHRGGFGDDSWGLCGENWADSIKDASVQDEMSIVKSYNSLQHNSHNSSQAVSAERSGVWEPHDITL